MKDDKRQKRHAQIARAAYEVLAEKGYSGASLLTIAKAAKASNETLYRWYGDKVGLFSAMVRDNAAQTREALEAAIETEADPPATLKVIAPILLAMVLGKRAVLLNRAAAADPTGELGQTIAREGRGAVAPLIAAVLGRLAQDSPYSAKEIAETFVKLLIGDLQIRRAIGAMPEPDETFIQSRSQTAIEQTLRLYTLP